jgi:hypothetical protein
LKVTVSGVTGYPKRKKLEKILPKTMQTFRRQGKFCVKSYGKKCQPAGYKATAATTPVPPLPGIRNNDLAFSDHDNEENTNTGEQDGGQQSLAADQQEVGRGQARARTGYEIFTSPDLRREGQNVSVRAVL